MPVFIMSLYRILPLVVALIAVAIVLFIIVFTTQGAEKAKEITEDESKRGQESMQKLVDKYVKLADAAKEVKEKEVMEV